MTREGDPLLYSPEMSREKPRRVLVISTCLFLLILAASFVGMYVVHYYLDYNPNSFGVYWPRRGGLLLHIGGGTLAVLVGPWQFWTGLRQTMPRIHRWTGRLFLAGVAVGVTGAFYLAATSTFGRAYGVTLGTAAAAWAGTAGMAFYAIRRGAIAIHKEWMIRAYVVTFSFVTFRLLNDWLLPSSLTYADINRMNTFAWLGWVVPLFVTLVIQAMASIPRRAEKYPKPFLTRSGAINLRELP